MGTFGTSEPVKSTTVPINLVKAENLWVFVKEDLMLKEEMYP